MWFDAQDIKDYTDAIQKRLQMQSIISGCYYKNWIRYRRIALQKAREIEAVDKMLLGILSYQQKRELKRVIR